MRNIVSFVWRHQFTFLFLFLELIAFFLLVQNNRFHQANFYSWANSFSGGAYSVVTSITNYFELKKENEQLAIENSRLKSVSTNSFIKLYGPLVYIEDTLYCQQYKYLSAKVVNNSVYKRNNYIILDQGSDRGVEPEMGVLCANGLVGVVKDVSDHYCSVISLLHKSTQVSVKIKKNNYFGILTWDGSNPAIAQLNDIPNHVLIENGDTVVSMGSSTIFPEGLPVGTINKVEKIDGSEFYDIDISLSTNFNSLSYVYIVKNLLKTEQKQLEELTEND